MAGKIDIVEASIAHLREALSTHSVSAVDLAVQHLLRISRYDCRGPTLNSIPLLNPSLLQEATAADDRRASDTPAGPLDGIPYTVKDSYKVKGMTVADGSPAFQYLMSNEDAFLVHKLREAGAVLMGKTNMCPMAYGGMQRGVYGRAENPYNPDYLAAAFASGSCNGSGVSTGASLAVFGLGGETVSSGRSPASNNGLVCYTPSKGLISVRGSWPSYPTCDVAIPHTRTMADLYEVLDVISASDPSSQGDFWRDQRFVQVPHVDLRRRNGNPASLKGLRIAVPSCYIGGPQLAHISPVFVSPEVVDLWEQAKADFEAEGAEVIITEEFPTVQVYECPACAEALGYSEVSKLPENWNSVERGALIAHAWDLFLRDNHCPGMPHLSAAQWERLFPAVPPDHPQIAYAEPANMVQFSKLTSFLPPERTDGDENAAQATIKSMYAIPNLEKACRALEAMRKTLFEGWLVKNNFDLAAFPAAGDVGRADADVFHESARHAWTNGIKYSHGNRAFRHLGTPSVTVPMGVLKSKGVPMGLTLLGPAYQDDRLLAYGGAFEAIRKQRMPPTRTPELDTTLVSQKIHPEWLRPSLKVSKFAASPAEDRGQVAVEIGGSLTMPPNSPSEMQAQMVIFVDSLQVASEQVLIEEQSDTESMEFNFRCSTIAPAPPQQDERTKTEGKIARDQSIVIVVARGVSGSESSWPSAWYGQA